MPNTAPPEARIAVYWDFENIHAAVLDGEYGSGEYKKQSRNVQDVLIKVDPVMEYIKTLGDVVINRAYANWSRFGHYWRPLLMHSVDAIQLFWAGANAKNGADIRLALDVVRDVQLMPHITHVVIIGGDSDFIPLTQRCRSLGLRVIGIGVRGSVNKYLIQSFNEFKYYRTLLSTESHEIREEIQRQADHRGGARLLARVIHALSLNSQDGWVPKAAIRPRLSRLDPTFDPANYGFSNLGEFINANQSVWEFEQGTFDHMYRLSEHGQGLLNDPNTPPPPAPSDDDFIELDETPLPAEARSEAAQRYRALLQRNGLALTCLPMHHHIIARIHDTLGEQPAESFEQLEDRLVAWAEDSALPVSPEEIRSVQKVLYKLRAFSIEKEDHEIRAISWGRMPLEEMQEAVSHSILQRVLELVDGQVMVHALRDALYFLEGERGPDDSTQVSELAEQLHQLSQP